MSLRPCHFAAAAVLVAACRQPEGGEPEALAGACPIDAPTRLVAAPPDFVADPDTWYGLYRFGDHVLFTFDVLDDPERVYWRLDRCTGELAPFPSLAPGLHNPYAIATADGLVLYANDALGGQYIVDRLDVPDDDEAQPVPGLPEKLESRSTPSISPYPFVLYSDSEFRDIAFAAGLGGTTWTYYVHAGQPDVPAVKLGDDIVDLVPIDRSGQRFYIHHDDGAVHRLDPLTGDRELLLTGVRHITRVGELDKLLWQEIGDDIAETIYLRDFATGEDVAIAVNDFAQQSWFRDPADTRLGRPHVTSDGAVAVLPGPGRVLVAAVRTDTGAALDIPEHLEFRGSFGGQIELRLADAPEHVEALWNPLTGDVREWYRGPAVDDLELRRLDGDRVDYFVPEPDNDVGALWRVDLATGDRQQLLARVSRSVARLDGDRYFLAFSERDLPGPPLSGSLYVAASLRNLKFADADDGLYTPIADDVTAFALVPDEGLVYLAPRGPEPGVWVHPFPHP